jgi:hypothetical protein
LALDTENGQPYLNGRSGQLISKTAFLHSVRCAKLLWRCANTKGMWSEPNAHEPVPLPRPTGALISPRMLSRIVAALVVLLMEAAVFHGRIYGLF